jgi:peptidyl-prolyl cis-trans isomerase A (cyclophilin A)
MIRLSAVVAFLALALSPLAPAEAQASAAAPSLKDPASFTEKAPATFRVRLDTTKGPVVIQVTRAWAPNGADRFYNLVKSGYLDEARFFRVVTGFMAQFGINPDPEVNSRWRQARIPDDPVTQSNKRGYVTFATSGPNSRTTQVFINFDDNSDLDKQGFAPFGLVTSGMDVMDKLYAGYGDGPPYGRGPDQNLIQIQGNSYLDRLFPMLDGIKKATIEP